MELPKETKAQLGRFSHSPLHGLKELCGVILKKVELHGSGDFQNQIAVERGFIENLIDVVSGAMDLTRQPTHAALVFLQLLMDKMSDVDVAFVGSHCLGLGLALAPFPIHKNSVNTIYYVVVGSGRPSIP